MNGIFCVSLNGWSSYSEYIDAAKRHDFVEYSLKYPGLTQRQVANELNVKSGSTISKQIVRSRKIIKDNGELNGQVEKCEGLLREMRIIDQLLND